MSRRKRLNPHQQSTDRIDTHLRTRPVDGTSPRRNRFWLIGALSFFLIAGLIVVFTLSFTSSSDSKKWVIPDPLTLEMEPTVRELIQKYGIEFVMVGQLERLYYPAEGLAVFDQMADDFERNDINESVAIYRVRQPQPAVG